MTLPDMKVRLARRSDVPAIVAMLANDELGSRREAFAEPLPGSYYDAFTAIDSDSAHELVVVEIANDVVGTLQLSFLPYLTYRGGWRAQIEAVRVADSQRGSGVGTAMIQWAVARATERGCHLVQLTTDKTRPDALRFYESLGFRATHEGLKLHLPI